MRKTALLGLLVSFIFAVPALGAPFVTPGESTGIELTVYNTNMALVKDTRPLVLRKGVNQVRFEDVAAAINPTTVHFKSVSHPGACVIREQNYQYDLVSRAKLLEKYLGKQITIKEEHEDGKETVTRGTLLSARDGMVVQAAGKLLLTTPDRVELPSLPEGLITRPTLDWMVESKRGGRHQVEVSYITRAIQWGCDYVAVASAGDDKLDINGWVTINNTSGAAYPDAKLKLMAGDVRVSPMGTFRGDRGPVGPAGPAGPRGERQFQEKAFFEYHMYSLNRKATVADKETKQIELLTASDIPVAKRYFFEGQTQRRDSLGRSKAQVKLEFKNSKANHLGMPLPKGTVRVYKADEDKSLQFIGEDGIDHTPKDEIMRLYVGDAFDIVCERKVMSTRKIAARVTEQTVQLKVRNHKDDRIEITCVEHASGDWSITEESHPHVKKDGMTFEFGIPVEADGETTVAYTVRTER